VVAIVLAAVVISVWTGDGDRSAAPDASDATVSGATSASDSPQALLAAAGDEALAAGCGEVTTVAPYPESRDAIHVADDDMPPLSSWPSIPPASGPHAGQTLATGSYAEPPPMLNLIHSLEHGAAVVWYAPAAPPQEIERIVAFYSDAGLGEKVIVAPYNYPDEGAAGQLPKGVQMALVAWHRVRHCEHLNLATAFAFSAEYASPPFDGRTYLGEAPEPSVGI